MNLDELQSVQARERQSSDLQHLRSSFYREVGEFINGLNEERARVVEAADDPFSEPEVRRLTDDIETAEGTVEAIYERRVGKVVKKASIAAAGMPIEDDGLTSEEEALFEDLVSRIESNRETVLSVLDGEAPTVSCSIDEDSQTDRGNANVEDGRSATDPEYEADAAPPTEGGVSAADLMGEGVDGADEAPSAPAETDTPASSMEGEYADETALPPTVSAGADEEIRSRSDDASVSDPEGSGTDNEIDATEPNDGVETSGSERKREEIPGLPRTTVRITADVGEIVGADDRDYELGTEDVVTLPEPNADVLVEKDAAERLQ